MSSDTGLETACEDETEQLAQTTLQADGSNIAHRSFLRRVFDERHNDTRLPRRREGACMQAAVEQRQHVLACDFALLHRRLPQAR